MDHGWRRSLQLFTPTQTRSASSPKTPPHLILSKISFTPDRYLLGYVHSILSFLPVRFSPTFAQNHSFLAKR
ncbi:hypothetical protein K432DRAFT_131177 [Lepidopterella palustris CBS 459.81]|uniref:Uncharacterized protein n=1 Tax=Lepidopterella palustris CBS 459.81 TaxID=1314670 RepID=A0A8E2JJ69_9PEZI|nr:hypothetical protein K432DRAFT_131177 [Lepidopterella palustris CBS 459.81]